MGSVPWDTMRERSMTILYHPTENTVADTINVTYARRSMKSLYGILYVEYATAFPHSDWLYFLWHGMNSDIQEI